MSSKTSRKGPRFIEYLNGRVVVFICARFCLVRTPHRNDKLISAGASDARAGFTNPLAFQRVPSA
jgi:hypothetical protein